MKGVTSMTNQVEKAFQFALKKHEGQFRKGTDIPYITHPFAVGMLLKEHRYSDEVIAAGLLHDTLEDTETTESKLLQLFGPVVLDLVQGASEPNKSLSWEERKLHTIEELPRKSKEQLAVIVADKLHNICSIQADIDEKGEHVWDRFNRKKRAQSWYYMSLLNTLSSMKMGMSIGRLLDAEAKRTFIGTDKLTTKKIDLLFQAVYYLSDETESELELNNMLVFVNEVRVDAESVYRRGDFEPLRPLMENLERRGIEFEYNSDGPFILLAFCHELHYRLGWDFDETYLHVKRNLSRL